MPKWDKIQVNGYVDPKIKARFPELLVFFNVKTESKLIEKILIDSIEWMDNQSTVPKESKESDTVPTAVPNQTSTVPTNKSTAPPLITGTVPKEKSTVPKEKSTVPKEKSTVLPVNIEEAKERISRSREQREERYKKMQELDRYIHRSNCLFNKGEPECSCGAAG